MTDETGAAAPTAEQARQYSEYWAAQVHQTTGAEQAEAQRSATYWAQQAEELSRPAEPAPAAVAPAIPAVAAPGETWAAPGVTPGVQPQPTSSDDEDETPLTAAEAREYELFWAEQGRKSRGVEQTEAFASASYWQQQAYELSLEEAQRAGSPDGAPAAGAPAFGTTGFPAQGFPVPGFQAPGFPAPGQAGPGPQANPAFPAGPGFQAPGFQGGPGFPGGPAFFAPPRPPRPKLRELMTKGVKITAAVTAGALVLTLVGGFVLHGQRATALAAFEGPGYEEVAALYLDAAIARDAEALAAVQRRTFALPASETAPIAEVEPIVGDARAAKDLDLTIDYEIVQSQFFDGYQDKRRLDRANRAEVVVKLSYSLMAEGKKVTAWGMQVIQLERDFFDGGDTPAEPSFGEVPAMYGPWGVVGFHGNIPPLEEKSEAVGSDYAATPLEKASQFCHGTRGVLAELSDIVLRKGAMPATCFAGGLEFSSIAGEDLDYLVANLTPLGDAAMTDVVGLQSPFLENDYTILSVPFSEMVVTAGDRRFLFTLLLVDPAFSQEDDEYNEFRIVSVIGLN